jgi:hypothetical protein
MQYGKNAVSDAPNPEISNLWLIRTALSWSVRTPHGAAVLGRVQGGRDRPSHHGGPGRFNPEILKKICWQNPSYTAGQFGISDNVRRPSGVVRGVRGVLEPPLCQKFFLFN